MQILGKSFGKPVRKGFGHDRVVIVMILLKFQSKFIAAMTGRHSESADIVAQARFFGGDIIRKRMVVLVGRLVHLLAQGMEFREQLRPRFIDINLDVIANAVGREQTINSPCLEPFLLNNLGEKFLSIIEKFPGFWADLFVLENRRITSPQFPGMKEWGPIDKGCQFGKGKVFKYLNSHDRRLRDIAFLPINRCPPFACGFQI